MHTTGGDASSDAGGHVLEVAWLARATTRLVFVSESGACLALHSCRLRILERAK